MTTVLALVGDEHVAVATDSLLVVYDGDRFAAKANYAKVFTEGDRIGAASGVVMLDADDLGPVLAESLRRAPSPRETLPLFLREAAGSLRKGAAAWRRVVEGDGVASFGAFVAGFDVPRQRLEAYQLVVQSSGHFAVEAVAPGGELATGVLSGIYDAELARWSTRYRYEHLIAAYGEGRPGPAPHQIAARASAGELRETAVAAVAAAIEREAAFPHPDWWPPGVPVVAGPVQAASL